MSSVSLPLAACRSGHWRISLTIIAMIMAMALALFAVPMIATPPVDVHELTQAEFLRTDAERPPASADRGWQAQPLPDLWSLNRPGTGAGWYRLHLFLDQPPVAAWGIYLWRLNMNAGVYLNGNYLGDGGRFSEPMARNWNRPLYFTVPGALWRPGDNDILVRLKAYPGFGMLAPPQVGPAEALRPRYEFRQWLQNEIPAAMAALLATVGIFVLGMWLRRRHDRLYLWFAASSLCWALFSTHLFVRYPPIPPKLFLWLTLSAIDFWMVFLAGFVHRYLGLSHPHREQALIITQCLLAALFLMLPIDSGYPFSTLAHAVSLAVAFYLAAITWQHWLGSRRRENLLIALALPCLAAAGMHDLLMERPLPQLQPWDMMVAVWRDQFHLLFLVAPLLILFLGWHLTGRFVHAMNRAEHMNLELEARVSEVHGTLATNFEKRKLLERRQAVAEERERIYRDLHDDIGAKLLSLAIGAESPQRADLAREALQDLRDVVSRSGRGPQPLSFLLADWRAEMENRLAAAGLALAWCQPDTLPELEVSPSAALHVGRVLREAVTNVLRHAEARRLEVKIDHEADRISLCIEDDGKGLPAKETGSGRGTRNMRTRIQQLQGAIAWDNGAGGGCRLVLSISLTALAA